MQKNDWEDELRTELAFWRRWLSGDGIDTTQALAVRTDPNRELAPIFAKYLNTELPTNRVLDVGSGPLTTLGCTSRETGLEICAVDPLADEYAKLLDELGIPAPVRPQKASGESLTATFDPDSFDLTVAINALDHSLDPARCISEMVKVTKPGGHVVLQHNEREGTKSGWRGLHQWDLYLEDGRYFLQDREGTRVDAFERFAPVAECIEARMLQPKRLVAAQRAVPEQCFIVLRRKGAR